MSAVTTDRAEPVSSGEMPTPDFERLADIEHKHQVVAAFLESRRYDALLLQKPMHFAWLTSGGDCSRGGSAETTAALFITPEARVIVTTDVDSTQLFEREVAGLGFQLKERPWHEPRTALIEDLCRGRTVASDTGFRGTEDVSVQLLGMRVPLTVLECDRLRDLGRRLAHAIEATARHCRPQQSEVEIAAELAHRLIKHEVIPVRLQVMADGQAHRYPHWSFGDRRLEQFCTMAAVGRYKGLCAAAARTVCFGELPRPLREGHQRAVLMQATGMYFSRPHWELHEVWSRVRRIYEKYDCPNEWRFADQAEIIGYEPCEAPVVPKSEFHLDRHMAVHWHPKVGPAMLGDTILVGVEGGEVLTPMEVWPKLTVQIKGTPLARPDILKRTSNDPDADPPPPDNGSDSVLF